MELLSVVLDEALLEHVEESPSAINVFSHPASYASIAFLSASNAGFSVT